MRRLDDEGERSLVQMPVPVNRYPDFVRYIVQRLRVLCPMMGRRKIAEVLARAGLHLGATTMRRMSQDEAPLPPDDDDEARSASEAETTIIARAPHHVWGVDLTVVPTGKGFWTALPPFSWLQRWPFCYWLAVIVDHHSRKAIGFAVFPNVPTARDVTEFLDRAIRVIGARPESIITDRGKQFVTARGNKSTLGSGMQVQGSWKNGRVSSGIQVHPSSGIQGHRGSPMQVHSG